VYGWRLIAALREFGGFGESEAEQVSYRICGRSAYVRVLAAGAFTVRQP
jgi:hypothetical protein